MTEPRYGAPGRGEETERATREMEAQLTPSAPDEPNTPPIREDYGGPRETSDGRQVSPDPSQPAGATGASARRGHPAASGGGSEGDDREGEKPPVLPPDEPQPPPVKDPPAEPTPPYVVSQPRGPAPVDRRHEDT